MPRPYRESLLAPDERVALITRPHRFTFWGDAVRGVVVALLMVGLAVLVEQGALLPAQISPIRAYLTLALLALALVSGLGVLASWVRWRTREIVVTDRRVIRIAGVLSKDVIDYSLDAITDLRLRQSWLGRIFDYGDVDILTASDAANSPRDTFPVVSGPITFTHAVQAERERRRERHLGRDDQKTDVLPRVVVDG